MNHLEDFSKLEELIAIQFNNQTLLKQALIHRSYINESHTDKLSHNERLEFLGDAVLELLVTEYLFHTYPTRPEGELTSFRSATVRTESLAQSANLLELGKYIFMSKGEENTGGRSRPYILANTFEALLGAIYLDQGFETCKKFLVKFLFYKIEQIVEKRLDIDNKSKLQEISQEMTGYTPEYVMISDSGPDHDKTFIMGVKINDKVLSQGRGKNKQDAEQKAAYNAIKDWQNLVKIIKSN